MFVFNWMTSTPVCISTQDALLKAEELMKTHQVNQLLVQEAGKLVGIFSDRDLRDAKTSLVYMSSFQGKTLKDLMEAAPVVSFMTKDPVTLYPTDTLEDALSIFNTHRFNGLPVVDEDARPICILTKTDLLRAFECVLGVNKNTSRIEVLVADKTSDTIRVLEAARRLGVEVVSLLFEMVKKASPQLVLLIRLATINPLPVREALEAQGFEILDIRKYWLELETFDEDLG
jgi:acetoin utilization protein AcuB